MLTYNQIVNYFLTHPPFTIADEAKYLDLVQYQIEMTLLELSENSPIIEEKLVTVVPSGTTPTANLATGSVTDNSGSYVWLDLYRDTNPPTPPAPPDPKRFIDPNFMSFVLFSELDPLPDLISMYVSRTVVQTAIGQGNLMEIMALKDGIYVLLDRLNDKVSKFIYKDSKIKIKPNVEYYAIYRRYRKMTEIKPMEYRQFQMLLGCNVILGAYESDIFMSEDGISSFSMSGLSLSFNTPRVDERIRSVREQKDKILASMSIDGEDIGFF
jgi:hypothetical protein